VGTFLEQAELAADQTFILRVRQALVKSCGEVSAENPATGNHLNRLKFANSALLDPERMATVMAMGVATNPVITADSTDDDIRFTINSIFDAYAGIDPDENIAVPLKWPA
jgi:hypothetical protein